MVLVTSDDNPLFDILENGVVDVGSAPNLLEALSEDDDGQIGGVALVSVDEASFSVRVDNELTGELDYLVFMEPSGAFTTS